VADSWGQWTFRMLIEVVLTAIATVATAVLVIYLTPGFEDQLAQRYPKCSDPRGLTLVGAAELTAWVQGPTGTRIEAPDDRDQSEEAAEDYGPGSTIDGYTGSWWVPPIVRDRRKAITVDPSASTLVLGFGDGKRHDVRLVCAVNGLANSAWNYRNMGRVRTVEATTDAGDERRVSVLQTLDDGSFQNGQRIDIERGKTRKIRIRVVDTYNGQSIEVFDTDRCNPTAIRKSEGSLKPRTGGEGCIADAQKLAGIAEVQVFVA
jgi:hypothetical protein